VIARDPHLNDLFAISPRCPGNEKLHDTDNQH
jgi:hypothetical protein